MPSGSVATVCRLCQPVLPTATLMSVRPNVGVASCTHEETSGAVALATRGVARGEWREIGRGGDLADDGKRREVSLDTNEVERFVSTQR